jgi:hypothetical protein
MQCWTPSPDPILKVSMPSSTASPTLHSISPRTLCKPGNSNHESELQSSAKFTTFSNRARDSSSARHPSSLRQPNQEQWFVPALIGVRVVTAEELQRVGSLQTASRQKIGGAEHTTNAIPAHPEKVRKKLHSNLTYPC